MTRLRTPAQIFLDIGVLDGHGNRSVLSLPSFIEEVRHDNTIVVIVRENNGNYFNQGL